MAGKTPLATLSNPIAGRIELRACHRDKDIKQIIYKERSNQYKGHLFEPFEPINEIKQRHNQHHRIIEEISHIKRFADQNMRKRMAEPDAGCPLKINCSMVAKTWSRFGKSD